MVKQIYAEESIHRFVSKLVKKKKPTYGVVIGRMTTQRDFVLKIIRCPTKSGTSSDPFFIDHAWLAGSAVEVTHMLPGGICLVGIFVFAPADDKMQEDLRQALYVTHKVMSKSRRQLLKSNESDDDPLFYWTTIHFELSSGRPIICTQFDIRDRASSARPAEWRYQDFSTRWGFVKTQLEIDETLYLNQISPNIKQQLKETVNAFCEKISKAVVEIDGKMLNSEELFDPSPLPPIGTHVRRSKRNPYKWGRTAKCRVFFRHSKEGSSSAKTVESVAHRYVIRVRGILYACAYLHSKATVEDAVNELKIDAIFSLYHRCEVTADELREENKILHQNSVLVLPRRVGFAEPGEPDNFVYFDYVFENEKRKECLKRIKDHFDTEVAPKNLIINLEEFPSRSDVTKLAVAVVHTPETETMKGKFHTMFSGHVETFWFHYDALKRRRFRLKIPHVVNINMPFLRAMGWLVVAVVAICVYLYKQRPRRSSTGWFS